MEKMTYTNYEQYGKIREPKHKDKPVKDSTKKPQYFYDLFNDEEVELQLINGGKLTGTLHTTIENKYDVMCDDTLIPKHAILLIKRLAR